MINLSSHHGHRRHPSPTIEQTFDAPLGYGGWGRVGTIRTCTCAGRRAGGWNPVRPIALDAASRWDPGRCWSARQHVDVVGRTGRIFAGRASSRSTPLCSGTNVCSSRWTSATCARHSVLTATATRRHRRDGPGLQRLAGVERVPHAVLDRPTGVGIACCGSFPASGRAPAVGMSFPCGWSPAACDWIRGCLVGRWRGFVGRRLTDVAAMGRAGRDHHYTAGVKAEFSRCPGASLSPGSREALVG
jgi:hypothetical protein